DAKLNKVLYGSTHVGFLHREGTGDIGLDYLNVILVIQADIASALSMQKTNVSRAIKHLVEFGVLEEGPKVGR
ncbi:hypothetical protein, partial [Aeromonas hydrophila]|uniref:hypothetical protein n=1 Tax=Aeromonas hydrophila TaxID=644 RepID=UPI00403A1F3C